MEDFHILCHSTAARHLVYFDKKNFRSNMTLLFRLVLPNQVLTVEAINDASLPFIVSSFFPAIK
jgi:hypothetical protein